jgi:hypothetical protein
VLDLPKLIETIAFLLKTVAVETLFKVQLKLYVCALSLLICGNILYIYTYDNHVDNNNAAAD